MKQKKRIVFTVDEDVSDLLNAVYLKFGVSKSNQINNLLRRYLQDEYGNLSKQLEQIKGKGGDIVAEKN